MGKKKINYRKYPLRTCRWINAICELCLADITPNDKYYDGGFNRRVHKRCLNYCYGKSNG